MCYLSLQLKKLLLVCGVAVFLSGCGATVEQRPFVPPVYPAAPDEPRFIYERSLMGSADVEELTSEQKFKAMATGVAVGERGLIKPFDVAVHKGRVYITDTVARQVVLFNIHDSKFVEFGNKGSGKLSKPIGITVSPAGEVFVVDNSAKRVMVYDENGRFLRTFGSESELSRPADVAISNDGQYAYVVDTGGVRNRNHRLQKYDAQSGVLLSTIGTRGIAPGEFNLPMMIDIDSKGRIYVLDSGNFRVQRFNADGEFEFTFGKVGNLLGDFSRPKGLAIDAEDNIYVMDSSFANFQIFNEKGELLLFIGQRSVNNEPGMFSLPAGIAVDEDGRIYAVDQFFSKVEVFRPYSMKQSEGFAGVASAEK